MSLPSLTDTSTLIRHRRSIKPVDMDAARTVEPELVTELIENATWAPNHGMTEPWKFHVYSGAARQGLAEGLSSIYQRTTPAADFREDKFKKMGENPLLAPVIIACVMERSGGGKIPEMEEIEAVSCAMQNMMLSATAAGLGSFWSSPPVLETTDFQNWLGIRSEDRCMGLLYLGWPKPGLVWPRSMRQPVSSKITWHHD
ncbi:nitroreductase [Prosthecobacter fusiformis]|uniref:Putative NAD(P)H nitroreductase n=1 Tax=Prosthecobacter fusiformis TaxID=48464 RepID=A0A4R7SS99_9BACT|nr:nitroreductase [Prosthecobacter fusiformis]TDU81058.1 nitroreductase [Prosthecobacter fusiformis]